MIVQFKFLSFALFLLITLGSIRAKICQIEGSFFNKQGHFMKVRDILSTYKEVNSSEDLVMKGRSQGIEAALTSPHTFSRSLKQKKTFFKKNGDVFVKFTLLWPALKLQSNLKQRGKNTTPSVFSFRWSHKSQHSANSTNDLCLYGFFFKKRKRNKTPKPCYNVCY